MILSVTVFKTVSLLIKISLWNKVRLKALSVSFHAKCLVKRLMVVLSFGCRITIDLFYTLPWLFLVPWTEIKNQQSFNSFQRRFLSPPVRMHGGLLCITFCLWLDQKSDLTEIQTWPKVTRPKVIGLTKRPNHLLHRASASKMYLLLTYTS